MTSKIDMRSIRKLIKLMKQEGVLVLKVPEMELQISPSSFVQEEVKLLPYAPDAVTTEDHVERAEDLLFWSAPGQIPAEEMN